MKKYISLLGACTLAALLGSCKDDYLGGKAVNPVQTGDEILFGPSLSGSSAESRTEYGKRTNTGIPVYWSENDVIAVYCPESSAPESHMVKYVVNGNGTSNTSTNVTKLNPQEIGLQWGESEEHHFYAFYPGDVIEEANDQEVVTASIPVEQKVTWGDISTAQDGLDGKPTIFGLPDMSLAYMYATETVNKQDVNKEQPVSLKFDNLLTVLDITIQGPNNGQKMKITNITVSTDDENDYLTGDFKCYLNPEKSGKKEGYCEPMEDGKAHNFISISGYIPGETEEDYGDFVELSAGQLLNLKAYVIPNDDSEKVRKFKIRISTLNGTDKTVTINETIEPHKVNRILLPELIDTSGEPNYWMNNLDENIYITELSLPGSHQSVVVNDYSGNTTYYRYQNKNINAQFKEGVRAFSFQSDYYGRFQFDNNFYYWIEDFIYDIVKCLREAEQDTSGKGKKEFAFVSIGYTGSGDKEDVESYVKTIFDVLNRTYPGMGYSYSDYLYKDKVDNNTTLGDVKGKMVIMVDYVRDDINFSGNTHPALFTKWEATSPGEDIKPVDLKWGGIKENADLKLFTQNFTSINYPKNDDNAQLSSVTEKFNYVKQLFDDGVTMYQTDKDHHYMYVNNLGGYFVYSSWNGGGYTKEYSQAINPIAFGNIQQRTDNASLGVIFMNYADKDKDSGAECKSDYLIQTIIDNNFKFALRKRSTSGQ